MRTAITAILICLFTACGTTSKPVTSRPTTSVKYYRIKQVDKDGTITTFKVIPLTITK